MLSKVEARTPQGSLLTFLLDDPSNGFVVKDIDGLDPVKANLVSSSFALIDGEQYHSGRREARNIIIKLDLKPDYVTTSARGLRDILYDYFSPKSEVALRLYDGDLVVNISGRVETCECPIFTQEPSADISIVCFSPDFVENETEEFSGNSTSGTTETTVTYVGNVDVGFEFTLNVNRTLGEFTIYHRKPDGSLVQLDVEASLVSGDTVKIDTITGEKAATLIRSGVESSLLYAVSPQSTWTQLTKGDNTFRVYATGAAIPYTVDYINRYEGL